VNLPDFLTRSSDREIVVTIHRIGLFSTVDFVQQGCSIEQIHEKFPTIEVGPA
jgi:hypothetical protein